MVAIRQRVAWQGGEVGETGEAEVSSVIQWGRGLVRRSAAGILRGQAQFAHQVTQILGLTDGSCQKWARQRTHI